MLLRKPILACQNAKQQNRYDNTQTALHIFRYSLLYEFPKNKEYGMEYYTCRILIF